MILKIRISLQERDAQFCTHLAYVQGLSNYNNTKKTTTTNFEQKSHVKE